MLNEKWKQEQEADKEAEKQKFILNRARNIELIKHNEAEKQLRSMQSETEKARDMELLEAAIAREKALQEIEEKEK